MIVDMIHSADNYSKAIPLIQIKNNLPDETKEFFDFFFTEGSKEVNDFLGINILESKIFFDQNNNPIKSVTSITFPKRTQTFDGRVHGGMIMTALDITLGVPIGFATLLTENEIMVTKEISKMEIIKPVPTEKDLTIEVECEKREGRKFWMTGQLKDGEIVLATAKGFFLSVSISNYFK